MNSWQRGSPFLLKQSQLGGAIALARSVEYAVADAVGSWIVGLNSCLTKILNASLQRAAVNPNELKRVVPKEILLEASCVPLVTDL